MTTITSPPQIHSQLVKASCFLLLILLPPVDMIDEQYGRKNKEMLLDTGQIVGQMKSPKKMDNGTTTTSGILGDGIPGSTVGTFLGGSGSTSQSTFGWPSLSPTFSANSRPSPGLVTVDTSSSSLSSSPRSFHSGESGRGTTFMLTSFLPTSTSKRIRHLSQGTHNSLMTTVISATLAASSTSPAAPSLSPHALSTMQQLLHNRAPVGMKGHNSTIPIKEKAHHQKKNPLVVEPPVSLAVSSSSSSSSRNSGPYFETNKTTINVSAREGETVMLDCAVALLQGRVVSWIRKRKDTIQLLTVGNTTYNQDSRLGLRFRYPNNWRLGIDLVTKEDEGEYQCQLSTHPKIKTLIYNLRVTAPAVMILDENGITKTERHYKVDSSLHLTCKASHVDKSTENRVTWLKGGTALPINDKRIKVRFEKNPKNGDVSAYLSVSSVHKGDSGNYTCRSSSLATSTIVVHVLNGELPAAVQHESSANSRLPLSSGLLALASMLTVMMSASIVSFPVQRAVR